MGVGGRSGGVRFRPDLSWSMEKPVMLTFTFLGVGSAFAKRNYQSNVLVEAW